MISSLYLVKTAFFGLTSHKSRSLLTVLGIVIGVTAIILVMSLGAGAKNLILSQIQGLGSQTIIVSPGREPEGPANFAELFTDSLKMRDVSALQDPSRVQGIEYLAPSVLQIMPVSSEEETIRASVMGTNSLLADIIEIYPAQGVFASEQDIAERASVVVLGADVAEDLFGNTDPLGKKVKIKGHAFRVIGVLPPKGQIAFMDVDHLLFVPYTTAQEYLMGIDYFTMIIMRAVSEESVPRIVREIQLTLREQHGIADPGKDDFHVMTQVDAVNRVGIVTGILTALLTSVAGISLVVGGIGIMNIMLVSVTERTREIGLRKAIGATDGDIMLQFLMEAVILTGIGGLIGILLGSALSAGASAILSKYLEIEWVFVFPLAAAALGLGVSSAVGLLFGLYPAQQAAKKSPIEALRYE